MDLLQDDRQREIVREIVKCWFILSPVLLKEQQVTGHDELKYCSSTKEA